MTELTDRYVGATLTSIPEKQRADIEAELRASIADAVEARIENGEDAGEAEKAVLTDLGDPDRLASSYSGRSGYLIGPDIYFTYRRFLVTLLLSVVPIVVTVVAAIRVVVGDPVGEVVVETVGIGFTVALNILFWTTLGFAIVEWTGDKSDIPEWNFSKLPPAPTVRSVTLPETIGAVAALAFAITAILVQRTVSPVTATDGSVIPVFEPSLWSFWLPFLVLVLGLEVIFEFVKYRTGRWTARLAWVNLALNVLFAVPAIWLLVSGRLLNQEFFNGLGWPTGADPSGWPVRAAYVAIAAVSLWDVIDGFRRARK